MAGSYSDQVEKAALDIRRRHAADEVLYRIKLATCSDQVAMALLPGFSTVLYDCLINDANFAKNSIEALYDRLALETKPETVCDAWKAKMSEPANSIPSIQLVSNVQYELPCYDERGDVTFEILVSPMFDCIDHFSGYSEFDMGDESNEILLTFTELADVFV